MGGYLWTFPCILTYLLVGIEAELEISNVAPSNETRWQWVVVKGVSEYALFPRCPISKVNVLIVVMRVIQTHPSTVKACLTLHSAFVVRCNSGSLPAIRGS